MKIYMDFDNGEFYTEEELKKGFEQYDETGRTFEEYMEEMLRKGRERTGGYLEVEPRDVLSARVEELRKHGYFTAKDDDGKAMVEYILLQDAYIEGTNEDPYFTALAICPEDDFDEYGWIPVYEITWYALDEWLEGDRSDECLACDWKTPDDIQRLKVYYDPKDGTWI